MGRPRARMRVATRDDLGLCARQALAYHLRLQRAPLLHLIELVVLREARLPLLIDHEHEAHHGVPRRADPTRARLVETPAAVRAGAAGARPGLATGTAFCPTSTTGCAHAGARSAKITG